VAIGGPRDSEDLFCSEQTYKISWQEIKNIQINDEKPIAIRQNLHYPDFRPEVRLGNALNYQTLFLDAIHFDFLNLRRVCYQRSR
jgi:hypothetical protein